MAGLPGIVEIALEEFLANSDVHYYDLHELHNGRVVTVSPPSNQHVTIQRKLEQFFQNSVDAKYTVWREFYYTLRTESRRSDVSVVLESRRQQQSHQVFAGSAELTVEVLSPSNTAADLIHLRRMCLADRTEQFWIVDPFEQVIEIYDKNGSWREWQSGETIATSFDSRIMNLPVDSIFAE